MPYPHLNNAPVNEALIDIRVQLPEDIKINQLNELHSKIISTYPNKRERRKWEGKVEFREGQAANVNSVNLGIDGYLFASSDKLQIVQFRLDGFTFSRLKPYQDWEALKIEAERLWNIYRENTHPLAVSRVAVRYINLMEVPIPVSAVDYLKQPPQIPTGCNYNLDSFLNRTVMKAPDDVMSIVTQILEKSENAIAARLVLDIDVFKQLNSIKPNDLRIWEVFASLRQIKNDIFFGSITEKTVEMCR